MKRAFAILLLPALMAMLSWTSGPILGASAVKRDPPDQPFRRAPMAESSRSVVIPLTTNLHLAFDAQLCRTHTVWAGPGLNLHGPPYTGEKSPFLCDIGGTVLWTQPPVFPWSVESQPDLTERPAGARFRGISTKGGGGVTLMYQFALADGEPVRVLESATVQKTSRWTAVVRRFEIGPCGRETRYLAQSEPGTLRSEKIGTVGVAFERPGDVLLVVARPGRQALSWELFNGTVDYERRFLAENKLDSEIRRQRVTSSETRCYLRIPAHVEDDAVEICTVVCADKGEAMVAEEALARSPVSPADPERVSRAAKVGGVTTAKVVEAGAPFGGPPGGDRFYRIEHFPLPKQLDFLVGGMDWLPGGDLAVCTWPGDVYLVEGAQGPPEKATYRRFARGLNEPLGLKVAAGRIYVAQKCELTRLDDTDGDGEADLYETVNDDWGFSGNYHAFVFGPEVDGAGSFYVFPAGQRGLWEVPYVGWCLKIPSGGGPVEGFCRGLRAPNGWAAFGPEHELFVTDNQGEWVGACKLNHLRRGKFYGFPSGNPAPESEYRQPATFEPPAVWFPRKLGPSASGIAVITDERFGPFKGQMLVGDFQNGLLMRVALEKVGDEWQGAIWPFARGFLGAVNRLSMGPDGRLYVGGCKRAWSTPAPLEQALERVTFTGQTPFEVKEVHARSDGLELIFTKRVDATAATNKENYSVSQFRYRYSASYGSPEIDLEGKENSSTDVDVVGVSAAADGGAVRLTLKDLKAGCVTTVRMGEVTSASGERLWHDTFYYTLNRIPE